MMAGSQVTMHSKAASDTRVSSAAWMFMIFCSTQGELLMTFCSLQCDRSSSFCR